MKKGISIILAIVMMLSLTACGGPTDSSNSPDQSGTKPEAQTNGNNETTQSADLVWGVASLGSSAQMVASAISTVVTKYNPNIKISVQATAGSNENVRLLKEKGIGIANVNDAYNAAFSKGAYEGEEPAELWGLFNMYSNAYVVCVPAESDIKTLNDLVGKKVSLGPSGSGVYQAGYAMFEAHNLIDKIKIETLGYNDANDALKDGTIDALVGLISGEIPSPALAQLDTSTKIRVLDIDQTLMKNAYDKYPDFSDGTLPAGCISAITQEMHVMTGYTAEFADSNMSDEVAYQFVKAIYEHVDELGTYHQIAGKLSAKTALAGLPAEVPVHPGAAKYYKEIGAWRDDLKVATR